MVVSDEAGAVLDKHRDKFGFTSLDNAMDDLLLAKKREEESPMART